MENEMEKKSESLQNWLDFNWRSFFGWRENVNAFQMDRTAIGLEVYTVPTEMVSLEQVFSYFFSA